MKKKRKKTKMKKKKNSENERRNTNLSLDINENEKINNEITDENNKVSSQKEIVIKRVKREPLIIKEDYFKIKEKYS